MSFLQSKSQYLALPADDVEASGDEKAPRSPAFVSINMGKKYLVGLTCLAALTLVSLWSTMLGAVLYIHRASQDAVAVVPVQPQRAGVTMCMQPVVRREWRTLSHEQRTDYVNAVKCLTTKPSVLHDDTSLYDDFPWVHKQLAAHRLYIHLYEKALQQQCGMQGVLPYWDWSQDWEAPEEAPVWDHSSGVGGDGDLTGPETVGEGRCVTDGPFAGLEAKYFDGDYQPHCLSRGFASKNELRELGKLIEPQAIADMMRLKKYEQFESEVEHRAHHFLSKGVRGDLSRFTGPNDPVFFLHHTNIDRLWWQWQQQDLAQRLYAYDGKANNVSDDAASLTHRMQMGGLGMDLPVVSLMETEGNLLCYTY